MIFSEEHALEIVKHFGIDKTLDDENLIKNLSDTNPLLVDALEAIQEYALESEEMVLDPFILSLGDEDAGQYD